MKLGLFPTMTVQHTGAGHAGQIYISEVNYTLMLACVLVVGGFRDTVALGHAYGALPRASQGLCTAGPYLV
jgi:KUP system potassium uptake protein